MKRFILFFIALGLLLGLSCSCLAAEPSLSVSNAKGGAGHTVYLTVTLNESVQANAVGVQCEYDKALLTALPELCSWEKEGLLSDFQADNMGVWAADSAEDLAGKICVLAFQVKEGVTFSQTGVTCTVVLKNGNEQVGRYTVEGTIRNECTHSYGEWKSDGKTSHTRVCSLCGGKNMQSHEWDDGRESPGQQGVTVLTKTCLVCFEKNVIEIPNGKGPVSSMGHEEEDRNPNIPVQSPEDQRFPGHTDPHSQPNQDRFPEPGKIDGTTSRNYIYPPEDDVPTHDHTHDASPVASGYDNIHTENETEIGADHDHTHSGEENPTMFWVILGVLVVAVVGGTIYLKK